MFNNVIDGKETFFGKKNSIFQSPKNRIFQKGLTQGVNPRSKKVFFFLSSFRSKIRPEIMLNSVRDRKESFFGPKKMQSFKVPKIVFF